jgi:hypothetical protein
MSGNVTYYRALFYRGVQSHIMQSESMNRFILYYTLLGTQRWSATFFWVWLLQLLVSIWSELCETFEIALSTDSVYQIWVEVVCI